MEPVTLQTASFFKRAVHVAEHYGFTNTHTILRDQATESPLPLAFNASTHGHVPHILRHYMKTEARKARQPLLFYTPTIVSHPKTPQDRLSTLTLSAAGVYDPLTELTLLKTALGILDEFGIRNVTIRVNSIGDSDSIARFMREAQTRLKEKIGEMSADHAALFKKDAHALISQLFTERHDSVSEIPTPINFLTTPSRKYFRDLLSLLEYAELPFELDDKLFGDHRVYTQTLYEIYAHQKDGTKRLVARGGRYDPLTKKHIRGTIPAAGIAIIFKTGDPRLSVTQKKRTRKPCACIVHIGREAHIKSITLVDAFRKAKLPVSQCLHLDRFSDQMAYAQEQKPKYMLIIGQKEAMQNIAIVRNTATQSQTIIPLANIPVYLREQITKTAPQRA